MQNTLVDAGPLVALFDASDKHHRWAVRAVQAEPHRMVTTWPVLAETASMLSTGSWIDCLEFIETGGIQIEELPHAVLPDLIRWAKKYNDLPMDLGDASLVAAAEALAVKTIFTLDRDFLVYRLADNSTLTLVP